MKMKLLQFITIIACTHTVCAVRASKKMYKNTVVL